MQQFYVNDSSLNLDSPELLIHPFAIPFAKTYSFPADFYNNIWVKDRDSFYDIKSIHLTPTGRVVKKMFVGLYSGGTQMRVVVVENLNQSINYLLVYSGSNTKYTSVHLSNGDPGLQLISINGTIYYDVQ